jgi:hypothetical protein
MKRKNEDRAAVAAGCAVIGVWLVAAAASLALTIGLAVVVWKIVSAL